MPNSQTTTAICQRGDARCHADACAAALGRLASSRLAQSRLAQSRLASSRLAQSRVALRWLAPYGLALMLASCGGVAAATESSDDVTLAHPRPAAVRAIVGDELAAAVHQRVNVERARAGLAPLAWQAGLVGAARGHSLDMARREYFSHTAPDGGTFSSRYAAAGFKCMVPIGPSRFATGGENLAQTHLFAGHQVAEDRSRTPFGWRTTAEIADRIVQGWMESPGHRENILRAYWRSHAIGVAFDPSGKVFATQNFC